MAFLLRYYSEQKACHWLQELQKSVTKALGDNIRKSSAHRNYDNSWSDKDKAKYLCWVVYNKY